MDDPSTTPEPQPAVSRANEPLAWLALWSDARLPAPAMLRTLADEHGGRAAIGLRKMAERVEAGDSLSDAFGASKAAFPAGLRRELTAADQCGCLRTALPALAARRDATGRMSQQVLAILAYPALVLVALLGLAALFSLLLIPQFEQIFNDFELQLPAITHAVVAMSSLAPWLIGGVLVAIAFSVVLFFLPVTAPWAHAVTAALPLFGRMWICQGHFGFSHLMASYTATGMQVGDALRATAAGVPDRNLALTAERVAGQCEAGQSLGNAMNASRAFERPLSALVAWGEQHGELPAAFVEASQGYQRQAELSLQLLRRVVPPLLLVAVILLVATVVIAIFLPLVGLIQNLSG